MQSVWIEAGGPQVTTVIGTGISATNLYGRKGQCDHTA